MQAEIAAPRLAIPPHTKINFYTQLACFVGKKSWKKNASRGMARGIVGEGDMHSIVGRNLANCNLIGMYKNLMYSTSTAQGGTASIDLERGTRTEARHV